MFHVCACFIAAAIQAWNQISSFISQIRWELLWFISCNWNVRSEMHMKWGSDSFTTSLLWQIYNTTTLRWCIEFLFWFLKVILKTTLRRIESTKGLSSPVVFFASHGEGSVWVFRLPLGQFGIRDLGQRKWDVKDDREQRSQYYD